MAWSAFGLAFVAVVCFGCEYVAQSLWSDGRGFGRRRWRRRRPSMVQTSVGMAHLLSEGAPLCLLLDRGRSLRVQKSLWLLGRFFLRRWVANWVASSPGHGERVLGTSSLGSFLRAVQAGRVPGHDPDGTLPSQRRVAQPRSLPQR